MDLVLLVIYNTFIILWEAIGMKVFLFICTVFFGLVTAYGVHDAIDGKISGYGWEGFGFMAFMFLLCLTCLIRRLRKPNKKQAEEEKRNEEVRPVSPAPQLAKRPQPAPVTAGPETPRPERPQKTFRTVYKGKVVGVTFQGRQQMLARLKRMAEEEYADLDFALEQDEYKGEPSIKVMAGLMEEDKPMQQIGFIGKADIPKVLPYIHTCSVIGEIYGGPEYEGEEDPKSYGCAIEVYIEEK